MPRGRRFLATLPRRDIGLMRSVWHHAPLVTGGGPGARHTPGPLCLRPGGPMWRGDRMQRESRWTAFWYDWRRPGTYMMVEAIVALSFKVHRVHIRNDSDPWMFHPRYFARRTAPPRLLPPPRRKPNISGPRLGIATRRA